MAGAGIKPLAGIIRGNPSPKLKPSGISTEGSPGSRRLLRTRSTKPTRTTTPPEPYWAADFE